MLPFALRSNPARAKVPIVALTSYAMAGDRKKALDAGYDDYIENPIDPTTFAAKIEEYLRRAVTNTDNRG